MAYLTSDAKKRAVVLGIDEDGKNKLYSTARYINKFLKEENELLQTEERESEYDERE